MVGQATTRGIKDRCMANRYQTRRQTLIWTRMYSLLWSLGIQSRINCVILLLIFFWPIIHGPNLSFYHISRLMREEMGLVKARSVRKVKNVCHLYFLTTHYPHSFSSSNALPLPPPSSLLSPMCFLIKVSNELTELGNVWRDILIQVLNDLYSFNVLLHSLRTCSDMTGVYNFCTGP